MAIANVNPTRMELTKLKKRLNTARRGHRLLKDKRDELMKRFLILVRENKELREKTEEGIKLANKSFVAAKSVMRPDILDESLMLPPKKVEVTLQIENMMSVNVPVFKKSDETMETGDLPYGFGFTSSELDQAVSGYRQLLDTMLGLAQREKSAQLLADEIEKTRRRVNALEYVMIPQLTDRIREITMKLEENERGNIVRLMKVKDMILEQKLYVDK